MFFLVICFRSIKVGLGVPTYKVRLLIGFSFGLVVLFAGYQNLEIKLNRKIKTRFDVFVLKFSILHWGLSKGNLYLYLNIFIFQVFMLPNNWKNY